MPTMKLFDDLPNLHMKIVLCVWGVEPNPDIIHLLSNTNAKQFTLHNQIQSKTK